MACGAAPKQALTCENMSGMPIPPYSVVQSVGVGVSADGLSTWIQVNQYSSSNTGSVFITGQYTIPHQVVIDGATVNGRGTIYFDDFLYVAVAGVTGGSSSSSGVSVTAGSQWGPVSGQWNLGSTGTGFTAQGSALAGSNPERALFYRNGTGGNGSSGSGGGDSPCGCCNCTNCINPGAALVGGCAACPNGAPTQYTVNVGTWAAYPELGGDIVLTNDCASQNCGSSSSSTSASSGCIECQWESCPITVSPPMWMTGVYYFVGDYVIDGGNCYVCIGAGTSAGGPSGSSSGSISDGAAVWDWFSTAAGAPTGQYEYILAQA